MREFCYFCERFLKRHNVSDCSYCPPLKAHDNIMALKYNVETVKCSSYGRQIQYLMHLATMASLFV